MAQPITDWGHHVAKTSPDLLSSIPSNTKTCSRISTSCSPSCRLFDPEISCKYLDLEIHQRSFSDCCFLTEKEVYQENKKWELFYGCFHPKKAEDPRVTQAKEAKRMGSLVFPNDGPNVPDDVIIATARSNQSYPKTDPNHWNDERKSFALSGDTLKRRVALSNWYWHWYNSVLKPRDIQLTTALGLKKNKLDNLIYKRLGEDFDETTSIKVKSSDKDYPQIKATLSENLLTVHNCGLNLIILD